MSSQTTDPTEDNDEQRGMCDLCGNDGYYRGSTQTIMCDECFDNHEPGEE